MIYATLTIRKIDGTLEELAISEKDLIIREDGGFELTFASSPGTTTFIPDHRVWEYTEVNTDKIPKRAEIDDEEHYIEDTSLDY